MSSYRDVRREAAVQRQNERDKRSPAEQLEVLDARLGKDQGAKKERARLKKMINS